MDNYKVITHVPGWAEEFSGQNRLSGGPQAYTYVPLVYRCVRLISDSLASVSLKVYQGKGANRKEVDWPFPDTDPVEWTWKTTAAILLTGASYSIKLKNLTGKKILGMQWLNPLTVKPEVNQSTAEVVFSRVGNISGGSQAKWSVEEMLYFKEFNLADDVLPGQSAAGVALTDAGLLRHLSKFASFYFEHGAMPITMIPVPMSTSDQESKRLEAIFKNMMSGISNAFRIVAMRTGKDSGQPVTLTPPLKDLAMPQLQEHARRAVAAAFGIPQTMLEDAANFATASEHTQQFWTTCIRPRGRMIMSILNRDLFHPSGMECEYAFDELDIFQEDEASRAESLSTLVSAGIPLDLAMDILGYDLDDTQKQRLSESLQPKEPDPAQEPPRTEQMPPVDAQATRSALFNWKRAVLKAFKICGRFDIDFDNPAIDEELADSIRADLLKAKSVDDVHAIFKRAREWNAKEDHDPVLAAELKRANDLLEKAMA